jgi:hypothetical protein
MSNQWFLMRLFATFAAAGFITAVVLAACYLLSLPIFDRDGLAWCLFYAMVAAGFATFALIARSLWGDN